MPRTKTKLYHFFENLSHEWVVVEAKDKPSAWKILTKHLQDSEWVTEDGHEPKTIADVKGWFRAEQFKPVK